MTDCITCAIRGLTSRTIAYRLMLQEQRGNDMNRLTEKLNQAAGVAGRLTSKIEARADAIIARESALESRTEQVFSPHETILTDAERGLDAVERSLALMSNDPLGASASSQPAGSPASTEPA